jgi:hypothetical protein
MAITFRYFEGPEDIELQYVFWNKATAYLPYAWKPTLSPKLYLHQQEFHPKSRCFAYDGDRLVGYISFTGQGDFVSLGYPWVLPGYEGGLQDDLYDKVYHFAASDEYGGKVFAQRFRSQWAKQIEYFLSKGFAITNRSPIMGVELANFSLSDYLSDVDYKIEDGFQFEKWQAIHKKNESITPEQAGMMEQYYGSVAFDFSLEASKQDESIGYFGVTIRQDTGYSELVAVGLEKSSDQYFESMFNLVLVECKKRGAKTVSISKGSIPEKVITDLPIRQLTEEYMLMKQKQF